MSTSLLQQVMQQDNEAWRRLTQIYGPSVYGWCRSNGLQPADAADVMQEVFVAVLAHIASFRREKSSDTFRGWLWTIYHSKLMDFFRRRKAQPQAVGGDAANDVPNYALDVQSSAEYPSAASEADDRDRSVQRALRVIKGDFRQRTWLAFWRTVVGGERPSDVAADLGMTPAAVCMSRSRVLARLRETLGDLGELPSP